MSEYGLLVLTKSDDVQYYLVPAVEWPNIWSDDGYEIDWDAMGSIDSEFFSTTMDLMSFLREHEAVKIIEEATSPM